MKLSAEPLKEPKFRRDSMKLLEIRIFVVVCFLALSSQSYAAQKYFIDVNVLQTFSTAIDPTSTAPVPFGGCMARIDRNLQTELPACSPQGWVSFSCSGDFATKASAQANLSAAQLAMVSNTQAIFLVTDSQIHNPSPAGGFCVAVRVDNCAAGQPCN